MHSSQACKGTFLAVGYSFEPTPVEKLFPYPPTVFTVLAQL